MAYFKAKLKSNGDRASIIVLQISLKDSLEKSQILSL
jgi:hypothetical protein